MPSPALAPWGPVPAPLFSRPLRVSCPTDGFHVAQLQGAPRTANGGRGEAAVAGRRPPGPALRAASTPLCPAAGQQPPAGTGQQKSVVRLGPLPAEPAPAPRPALPAPPRPARRERLRGHGPAPAAAPAQMPRRSWRVGACPGAGAWAATASPPPGARRSELPESPRAPAPARLAQQEARGPWVPGRRGGGSRRVVGRLPWPGAGARRGVRWAEGRAGRRRAGAGGGHREPHTPASPGAAAQRAPPTQPGAAGGREGGGVRRARKRKLLAGLGPQQLGGGRRDEELRGALPGMVSGPRGGGPSRSNSGAGAGGGARAWRCPVRSEP